MYEPIRIQSDDVIVWLSAKINTMAFLQRPGTIISNNLNLLATRGKIIYSVFLYLKDIRNVISGVPLQK